MMAKMCDAPSKWDRVLLGLEYSINNTICRATGETPARLLFGVEQRGSTGDVLRDLVRDRQDADEERDLSRLREDAAIAIKRDQEENAARYNLRRKPARKYKTGDYVDIRNVEATAGINRKLLPKFKGPYVVKKVLDNDRYVITDVDGFQLTQRPYTGVVAPDQMRPYLKG